MENEYKIAIVGARMFNDFAAVDRLVTSLRDVVGSRLVIVSGGQPRGADGFAKRAALAQGVPYREFPPRHYKWNKYCVLPPDHYGKTYRPSNFFDRNTDIADYSDFAFGFLQGVSRGTWDTLNKFSERDKFFLTIKSY